MRDVQVRGGYVLHVGAIEGTLKVGDKVVCTIDGVGCRRHMVMGRQKYMHIVTTFYPTVRVVKYLCIDV